MDKIAAAHDGFRSLTESVDTTTPAGRMLMQILGSFAEFERSMIRERGSTLRVRKVVLVDASRS